MANDSDWMLFVCNVYSIRHVAISFEYITIGFFALKSLCIVKK